MEQGEQHAHHHGQNKTQSNIVIHQLRYQQSAEQRAEEPEAHGNGQGELFQRFSHALHAVARDAAGEDRQVGEGPQGNGGVDIGQGRGQGNGVAVDRNGLEPQKLKQRSYEYVGPGGKDISPQKAAAVRAAAPGHAAEQAHRLLQQHLESPRPVLELWNHENPDTNGGQKQNQRHRKRGNQPRVHLLHPKEADPVHVVQHGVPHGLLHRLRPAGRAGDYSARQQQQNRPQPQRQALFMFFHQASLLSIGSPCPRPAGKAASQYGLIIVTPAEKSRVPRGKTIARTVFSATSLTGSLYGREKTPGPFPR